MAQLPFGTGRVVNLNARPRWKGMRTKSKVPNGLNQGILLLLAPETKVFGFGMSTKKRKSLCVLQFYKLIQQVNTPHISILT